jgi:hypothetical protein
VLVVQAVQPRAPAELTQAMVDLLLFQAEELLLLLQLVAVVVVMEIQLVHLVDQVEVVVLMALADPALWVKVI